MNIVDQSLPLYTVKAKYKVVSQIKRYLRIQPSTEPSSRSEKRSLTGCGLANTVTAEGSATALWTVRDFEIKSDFL